MPSIAVSMNDEPETGLNLLQKGLQAALVARGAMPLNPQRSSLVRKGARILGKLGLIRPLFRGSAAAPVIVPVVWASEATLFPATYTREVIPYIFDCWPEQFDRWEGLLRRHRVKMAFFTAGDAALEMQRRLPSLTAHWLPEACDPSRYVPSRPLTQRSIHVLEMGRKHPSVHPQLVAGLAQAGKNHLFSQRDSSTPIFEGLAGLYAGMGDAAISICFPKSLTHAPGAGPRVETLTQRYLETMGNGALAVGACPAELTKIFGFDPVVPLSLSDPAGQVLEILRNLDRYQPHVMRCAQRLRETCTFEHRADAMMQHLAQRGTPAG